MIVEFHVDMAREMLVLGSWNLGARGGGDG